MNSTVIIAVSSSEYLSRYKVLYDSIKKNVKNCDSLLYFTGTEEIPFENVKVSHWLKDTLYPNNPFYQHCSIRPTAVLDAFNRGYEKVILVGADTEFFSHPEKCLEALEDNDCFVTMYTHQPYDGDNVYTNDITVLENGQINADLIGFRKSEQVIKFIDWVEKRTKTQCQINNKVYVDQCYFSMCFSFLDKVKVIRELGYNVGSYNVINRGLHFNKSWLMKDNSPLVLYHFDGFIKGKIEQISKHQNRDKAAGDLLDFLKLYDKKI